jgi:hypothetical protein
VSNQRGSTLVSTRSALPCRVLEQLAQQRAVVLLGLTTHRTPSHSARPHAACRYEYICAILQRRAHFSMTLCTFLFLFFFVFFFFYIMNILMR